MPKADRIARKQSPKQLQFHFTVCHPKQARVAGMDAGVKWNQLPWEQVTENISRKVIMGKHLMMIYYRFQPFQKWPAETHTAEQGGYILKGKIILKLEDEKKERQLGPGDGYLIASNQKHSWQVLDEEVLLVDFFSPPRKELINTKYAPLK